MTNDLGGCVITRVKEVPLREGEQGICLLSDLHLGAANLDETLLKRELDRALSRRDRILINGDVFDGILPRDKRFDPSGLHPRFQGRSDILNAICTWAYKFLEPYASLIDMIGIGNHCYGVLRYSSFDPVGDLVTRLNDSLPGSKPRIAYGGYCGFVDYRFTPSRLRPRRGGTPAPEGNCRFVIYYHHGAGAASTVNGSAGRLARKLEAVRGADVIWHGHHHSRLSADVQELSCPAEGSEPCLRSVRLIQTGAYLRAYGGQSQASFQQDGSRTNYAAREGYNPSGLGGARVVVRFPTRGPREIEVTQ